jgi:DNA-directed RNA polymerase subunit beta
MSDSVLKEEKFVQSTPYIKRYSFLNYKDYALPKDLLEIPRKSYEDFLQKDVPPSERKNIGLQNLFLESFPVVDFNERAVLEFVSYSIGEVKYSEEEAKLRGLTYAAPLRVKFRLIIKKTGEVREQVVFMREIPILLERGSFIINGVERVIVNQLHRSPGIFYNYDKNSGIYSARIIPYRGAWLEIELDVSNVIHIRIGRKRKIPATVLLRALGYVSNEEILSLFLREEGKKVYVNEEIIGYRLMEKIKSRETEEELPLGMRISKGIIEWLRQNRVFWVKALSPEDYRQLSPIVATLERDDSDTEEKALIKLFNTLRPGEPFVMQTARQTLQYLFFDPFRYNLSYVGRYKINQKLGLNIPQEITILTKEDIVEAINYLLKLYNRKGSTDDIDNLANRRVRPVGEMLHLHLRPAFLKFARTIKERMAIQDLDIMTPQSLVNIKPIVNALRSFFGTNQLSQFLDQTNPLAELTHKRRLSALGYQGLSKERAGFEVRDVQYSHYGKICPVETPEGQNIGLIISLAILARVNEFGFIETPFVRVEKGKIDPSSIRYLTAQEEENYVIAHPSVKLSKDGVIEEERVLARYKGEYLYVSPNDINFIDSSLIQTVSLAASLIPFLEHNDANRALMGSNMQRQAVPLLQPEVPFIATGTERIVAEYSGVVHRAPCAGTVIKATAREIVIRDDAGKNYSFKLIKYKPTNQNVTVTQSPEVKEGDRVEEGQILTSSSAITKGELALGRNVLVAIMSWEGYNFEDSIIISERLVKEDIFTSIHIQELVCEVRETPQGRESITRDLPHISEEFLTHLDENGIVRCGAYVKAGDIIVGKVTPREEEPISPEFRLLYSVFGEKVLNVKDSSLRVPYGVWGTVIEIHHFKNKEGDVLPPGIEEKVIVYVAVKRKIKVGDKVAGRHGNKGVISTIVPIEDMPYTKDGTPVDMIINPLSVPSRMNLGQLFETTLGWCAKELGILFKSVPFSSPTEDEIKELLREANLPEDGKVELYDGKTGRKFDQKVTIGWMYIMKLVHLVEEKVHARSIGPYSLITQQPLGGKAQFGGQRFGEMEVWALEAYGAAYTLQELLTIKSDDIRGRTLAYEAIVRGEQVKPRGLPESFNVIASELKGVGLDIKVLDEHGKEIDLRQLYEEQSLQPRRRPLDLPTPLIRSKF